MHTKQQRQLRLTDPTRSLHIGRDHALLDQPVSMQSLLFANAGHEPISIELKCHLIGIKVQRATTRATLGQDLINGK